MFGNILAPVASLLAIAHLLLQAVLALFCLFLLFSSVSGGKPFVPEGIKGILGLIGALCALQGRHIQRDWFTGRRPNLVRIIAMAWTVSFGIYAIAVLKQPGVALIAGLSAIYMMLRFIPEPVVEKKAEAAIPEEKPVSEEPKP